ncbi:metalloregulator ArsR/SmtB family transcription factor [Maribacter sp. 4G9]|uniref:ArsR/SmtB family transcription factor n=1 Tax=Croceitalea marina TaxID=1775166 RepID=A0ABW5N0I3_9FLAO|nr:metalloregulator ArsR/SmtB family transcription factor [Maribacter sp. 4G9]PIB38654.1 transcriptional regulator [Maribacter sp. 4G9]|tara:strand:- start:258 stop:629 length:372 start_codon:yes stop_codon:yes gene_type:complete
MKLEITCTRAEADHKQISRCRESLDKTSKTISEMGKIFSLAGNETRLKILFLLNQEKELCPCDFSDILKMSVPAISQHIRKMKDVDLITSRREGQTLFYSINAQRSSMLMNILNNIQSDKIAV